MASSGCNLPETICRKPGFPRPAFIWLRIGNCTNADLVEGLIPALPQIASALDAGDRLVEVS